MFFFLFRTLPQFASHWDWLPPELRLPIRVMAMKQYWIDVREKELRRWSVTRPDTFVGRRGKWRLVAPMGWQERLAVMRWRLGGS